MRTILLTGFEPFGDVESNPSQLLIEEISRRNPFDVSVIGVLEILPVVYDAAVDRIRELIQIHQPDLVLSFGVAARRDKVMPERVALNLKDTHQPDNAGNTPEGELITPGANLAYFSNLPLIETRDLFNDCGIPSAISNHAGAYICNAVFYAAAHEIEMSGMDTQYGFIHIPLISDEFEEGNDLTICKLTDGVIKILALLSSYSENR